MSADKERIIDKLKKLLALTRSDNPHEAALALQRAQKLMNATGITRDDIALADIGENAADWTVGSHRPPAYMLQLVGIIRHVFAVESLLTGAQMSFYGPMHRSELAAHTFVVLSRQLITARKKYIAGLNKRLKSTTKTSRGDKYAEGWVLAVYSEVTKMAMTEQEAELSQRYIESQYGEMRNIHGRDAGKTRGGSAANDGYRDGKNVSLHRPVHGQEQTKIGRTL